MQLLCSKGFISSPYYNEIAYTSTEKIFILLNVHENLISENVDSKTPSFYLQKPLIDLLYWEVFFEIVLLCKKESVAVFAVKFITSLPSKLSLYLISINEVSNIRMQLVKHCMLMLEKLKCQLVDLKSNAITMDQQMMSKIRRCLMILNEILKESLYDARDAVRSHGYKHHKSCLLQVFTIKINISSKDLQLFNNSQFQFPTSCTIDDVVDKICSHIDRNRSCIRIHMKARDITAVDPKLLLRQVLPGEILKVESAIVVEKPGFQFDKSYKSQLALLTPDTASNDNNVKNNQEDNIADPKADPKVESLNEALTTLSEAKNSLTSSSRFPAISQNYSSPMKSFHSEYSTNTEFKPLLPAVVISQTPEYMDLLFDLLDLTKNQGTLNSFVYLFPLLIVNTSGSICDDVWTLLNQLPSSPIILNSIISLNCVTVTELIISLITIHDSQVRCQNDSTNGCLPGNPVKFSISRLLYILIIIDYLLQPVDNLNDLEVLPKHLFNDINQNSDKLGVFIAWSNRFLNLDGCYAVEYLLNLVSSHISHLAQRSLGMNSFYTVSNSNRDSMHADLDAAIDSDPSFVGGCSEMMLMSTIGLLTKFYRWVVIKSIHSYHSDYILNFHMLLNTVITNANNLSDGISPVSRYCSKLSSNQTVGEPQKSSYIEHNTNTEFSECASSKDNNADLDQSPLICDEWGWRIDFDSVPLSGNIDEYTAEGSGNAINNEFIRGNQATEATCLLYDLSENRAIQCQRFIIQLMCSIRFYAAYVVSIRTKDISSLTSKSVTSSMDQLFEDTIQPVLNDIYVIWLTVLLRYPSLLKYFVSETEFYSSQELDKEMHQNDVCINFKLFLQNVLSISSSFSNTQKIIGFGFKLGINLPKTMTRFINILM